MGPTLQLFVAHIQLLFHLQTMSHKIIKTTLPTINHKTLSHFSLRFLRTHSLKEKKKNSSSSSSPVFASMEKTKEEEDEVNGNLHYTVTHSVTDSITTTIFTAKKSPLFHTLFALLIWLGWIHFIVITVFTSLFLPAKLTFTVFGLLLFFMVIPLNEESVLGRKIARFIGKHASGYFPMSLHVEDVKAFDPNQAYVFGYEPHSVLPIGVSSLSEIMGFLPLPKVKILASTAAFYTPFLRHLWTWCGIAPATRQNFISFLAAGYSCAIIPGGVQETLHMEHGSEVAFIKKRKGFIRIAMETGRPLVPVFCFGQSYVYKWWRPSSEIFVQFSRAIKFSPIIFWGRSPVPHQHPMDIVVGRPIELKKNAQPTMEEVNEVHSQFVESLQGLFERHKARVGHADLQLRIL